MTECIPCELAADTDTVPENLAKTAPWSGPIGIEGQTTGDGRHINLNALRWENLPVPLRYVDKDHGAHDGAVVVGRIDDIQRLSFDEANERLKESGRDPLPESFEDTGVVWGIGVYDLGSDMGKEAHRLCKDGYMPGISMDLDDVVIEETDGDDFSILEGRIRAATQVAIPAFDGARIAVDEDSVEQFDTGEEDTEAEFNWVDDVGGLPQYIKRISNHLKKKGMTESHAIATAVNVVKKMCATGDLNFPGAQQVNAGSRAEACAAVADWERKKAQAKATAAEALVASAAKVFEASWFENPHLTEPTAVVVTDEGRIFGHIAAWDTCHIANPQGRNVCTSPPRSQANYAYFRTGTVATDNGDVAVGKITMNTLHAGPRLNNIDAQHHYEHTGAVGAYVAAGEDEYGIWVAGAVHPDADITTLKAAPISGDWRTIRGNLELVGALSVNIPGFPIPRPQALVASGQVQSLVASGIMEPTDRQTLDLSDDEVLALRERFREMDNKDKAAALAAKVNRLAALEKVRRTRIALKDYSPEARKKAHTVPGTDSFPIEDCADLQNAIQAIGRAKDPEAAKAHIRTQKERLGCPDVSLPEDWATETFAYDPKQWRMPKGNDGAGRWIDMPDVAIFDLEQDLMDIADTGVFNDAEATMLGDVINNLDMATNRLTTALKNGNGQDAQVAAVDAQNEMRALEAQLFQHADNGTIDEPTAARLGEKWDAAMANLDTIQASDLTFLGEDSDVGADEPDITDEGGSDIGAEVPEADTPTEEDIENVWLGFVKPYIRDSDPDVDTNPEDLEDQYRRLIQDGDTPEDAIKKIANQVREDRAAGVDKMLDEDEKKIFEDAGWKDESGGPGFAGADQVYSDPSETFIVAKRTDDGKWEIYDSDGMASDELYDNPKDAMADVDAAVAEGQANVDAAEAEPATSPGDRTPPESDAGAPTNADWAEVDPTDHATQIEMMNDVPVGGAINFDDGEYVHTMKKNKDGKWEVISSGLADMEDPDMPAQDADEFFSDTDEGFPVSIYEGDPNTKPQWSKFWNEDSDDPDEPDPSHPMVGDESWKNIGTKAEDRPQEVDTTPQGSAQQQAGNNAENTASALESTLIDVASVSNMNENEADQIGQALDDFRDALAQLNAGIQDGNYSAADLTKSKNLLSKLEGVLMSVADGPNLSDEQANQIGVKLDDMFADLEDLASKLQGEMTPPPFAGRSYTRQWLGRKGIRLQTFTRKGGNS